MDYLEVYRKTMEWETEARAREEERERRDAAYEAEMSLLQFQAQARAERMGHAMLYLMFNPEPTPDAFGAILGVTPAPPAPNTGTRSGSSAKHR